MNESAGVETSFSVILGDTGEVDNSRLAGVFERHSGLVRYDAESAARQCRGFIVTGAARPEAEAVSKLCSDSGINTLVIPDTSVALLPQAEECTVAECLPEALKYSVTGRGTVSAAWESLYLVSAASVVEEKVTEKKEKQGPSMFSQITKGVTLMTTGIPVTIGRQKEVVKTVKETVRVIYLELFISSPACRLRINPDNFNYAYLGKRKEYSSVLNFYKVLADLDSYAVKALRNRGFEKFIKKETSSRAVYESYKDFEKESRWLATLVQAAGK